MTTINHLFSDVYLPQKALVVYRHVTEDSNNIYVEAYDMDEAGRPVNAHPLAVEECAALSRALDSSGILKKDYLKSDGLLPEKVLHIHTTGGFALWHTPPQEAALLFKNHLSIPCGKAHIPALIWKADRDSLYVYALKGKDRPGMKTDLYNAPFFNLYEDGRVCMGTVEIDMEGDCSLEEFISRWEDYFLNSYFSHLIQGGIAVKKNIVQLWQQQVNSGKPFPEDVLVKSPVTIKDLIR
jgi:PRTRC genetic system protein B